MFQTVSELLKEVNLSEIPDPKNPVQIEVTFKDLTGMVLKAIVTDVLDSQTIECSSDNNSIIMLTIDEIVDVKLVNKNIPELKLDSKDKVITPEQIKTVTKNKTVLEASSSVIKYEERRQISQVMTKKSFKEVQLLIEQNNVDILFHLSDINGMSDSLNIELSSTFHRLLDKAYKTYDALGNLELTLVRKFKNNMHKDLQIITGYVKDKEFDADAFVLCLRKLNRMYKDKNLNVLIILSIDSLDENTLNFCTKVCKEELNFTYTLIF